MAVGCFHDTSKKELISHVLKEQLLGKNVGLSAGEVIQRQVMGIYCLFVCLFVPTNTHTHTHTHNIYTEPFHYNTDAPTCFGSSAPSSGSFDIAFDEVIKYN